MSENIDIRPCAEKDALRRVWLEAFPEDTEDVTDAFFATAFHPEKCRAVLQDGNVLAALYWLDCTFENKKIAYIYAVATAKAYRKRGLCRLLMEETHRVLAAEGYVGAMLVPSEPSLFAFYEKMGYRTATCVQEIRCGKAAKKAVVRRITQEEYAVRRREKLPRGSVLQEGEALDFLATQADFFEGEDFLLAAYAENGVLHGAELLGNTDRASSIVTALSCEHGIFRTIGEGMPFAMYRSLADGKEPMPHYFGLALD